MSLPLLGCSVAGIIATVLAIIGLRKDQREFLVPFVFVMLIDVTIATIHFVKLVLFGGLPFDPMTGLIFTIDFFAICLNVSVIVNNTREVWLETRSDSEMIVGFCVYIFQTYCLVCILSQYQEYKSGYVNSSNEYIMVSWKKVNVKFLSIFTSSCLSPCHHQDETIVSYIAQPPPEKSCIVLHQSKNGSTVNINNNSVRVANLALIQESQKNGSASKCPIILNDWFLSITQKREKASIGYGWRSLLISYSLSLSMNQLMPSHGDEKSSKRWKEIFWTAADGRYRHSSHFFSVLIPNTQTLESRGAAAANWLKLFKWIEFGPTPRKAHRKLSSSAHDATWWVKLWMESVFC